MKLFASPATHFGRKVRLLLDHLELDYELTMIANVAVVQADELNGNPMRAVPVLEDGDLTLFESDHIAQHIVRTYAPEDTYDVLTTEPETLNIRAVLNGNMSNEVKLVMGARTGIDIDGKPYFDKARACLEGGMRWLEARADAFGREKLSYLDFHLVSSWDHLVAYEVIPMDYPALAAKVEKISQSEVVRQTLPPKPNF